MSKVLFVTDSYGFKATANGICVSEISEYYRDNGHEVHVLSFRRKGEPEEEIVDGIHMHRIKMNPINSFRAVYEIYDVSKFRKKLAQLLFVWINRIQSMIFLYWYPSRTPIFTYRYSKVIEKLYKKIKFDEVIASYAPYEAIAGTYLFKKKYPDVFSCMYILDSISNLIPRFFLSKDWLDKKGWVCEKKLYKKFDLILNMKCHNNHYLQARYDIFREKMDCTDIPHMTSNLFKGIEKNNPEKKEITFMYAGICRKITGNYAMKLLSEYSVKNPISLEIFTRSSKEEYKNDISKELDKNMIWHGFVSRDVVLKKEMNTDILICMGNPTSDFITSKIFEMMMTGNKIIHFFNNEHEPAIAYLKKYPNICLIDINKDITENTKKLDDFVKKPLNDISYNQLFEMFFENTPKFTYDIIEKNRAMFIKK